MRDKIENLYAFFGIRIVDSRGQANTEGIVAGVLMVAIYIRCLFLDLRISISPLWDSVCHSFRCYSIYNRECVLRNNYLLGEK